MNVANGFVGRARLIRNDAIGRLCAYGARGARAGERALGNIGQSMRRSRILAAFAAGCLATLTAMAASAPPAAPIRPVSDTYFGTEVVDNYRYLENLADPEVQAWMKAQADFTSAGLARLPGRAALLARIHALAGADQTRSGFIQRGQRFFYQRFDPGAQLPKLFYRDGFAGAEHLLLDPATLGEGTRTHYALDFYTPSWDGNYVAYGLSKGGSEESVLHVLEVGPDKVLDEAIERTSGSIVAWRSDNRSFYYLRYAPLTPELKPEEQLYNARTYLHVVGGSASGASDVVVFGRGVSPTLDVPEGQVTYIHTAIDSPYAIAVANHNDDDNPSTLYVAPLSAIHGANTPWRKIADVEDGIGDFILQGEYLYLLSRHDAPRFRVLRLTLRDPVLAHATVVVPEGAGVLTGFALASDGLYVSERDGAVGRIQRIALPGGQAHTVPLPFEGSIGYLATDSRESGVLFGMQGWVQSPRVLHDDAASNQSQDTGLMSPSSVDESAFEATEAFAVSYDGTRIPVSIVHKKGLPLDGSHPTILTGYGSYGVSLDPAFSRTAVAWLERGNILATAHIRGGGEYGEAWHLAGQKLTKINTILDFIACAQYLIDSHYTSAKFLAARGGSAGGITAGGALTWRPDLFGVVLDQVGISDALRIELTPNGPPNISEFGSVKTETGFHGLYAMAPYEHVHDGTPYPAVVFTTGANDPRVSSWQVLKMAARVQAATSSGRPVWVRIDYDAGHGIGSTLSQYEAELADLWSFTLWQMGDPAFQPKSTP